MVPEAVPEQTEHGLLPTEGGWFVLNAREAAWRQAEGRGKWPRLGGARPHFTQLGVGLTLLEPGEPIAMYHWETDQEDFLVLSGEAVAVVEGQERPLRQWDFLHCPAGTKHVIVGAGEGPCVVFRVGSRQNHTYAVGDGSIDGRDDWVHTRSTRLRCGTGRGARRRRRTRTSPTPGSRRRRWPATVTARFPTSCLPASGERELPSARAIASQHEPVRTDQRRLRRRAPCGPRGACSERCATYRPVRGHARRRRCERRPSLGRPSRAARSHGCAPRRRCPDRARRRRTSKARRPRCGRARRPRCRLARSRRGVRRRSRARTVTQGRWSPRTKAQPLGIVWYRFFTPERHGEGYVDEETPELAVAVVDGHRGQGIGNALKDAIHRRAREQSVTRISLGVDADNPAKRLYERLGYVELAPDDERMILVLT